MSDLVSAALLDRLLRRDEAEAELVRRQTTLMFEAQGLDRAKGKGWESSVRSFADDVGTKEADALADAYDGFTDRIDEWIERRQPRFVSDRWWDVARREIMYRIETWAWPLGSRDVMRLWDWALGTFSGEAAALIRRFGGDQADLLNATLAELVQFLDLWRPTVLAGLRATGKTVGTLARILVVKLLKAVVDIVLRLLYNGVLLVLGIVIRVLKSIPATSWLGFILGYVVAAVYTVEKALPG